MFILENASKVYGEVTALRDVSCTIPADSLAVIMGPSGSGKSTLLRLLSFVESPDTGRIDLKFDGETYSSTRKERPWPSVTCVFQKLFLWPHLTLRDNIALPLKRQSADERRTRIAGVVELLDMEDFVDRYPNEVSGGQAQRGALARALALDPRLVLIDEAHTGLDLEQQHVLNEHFMNLRSRRVGLVIVSHSPEFAYRYADFLVVIEEGRVVELGAPTTLGSPASQYLRHALDSMTSLGDKTS